MSVSGKILSALKTKLDFEKDRDGAMMWKELIPDISLFFQKENTRGDEGGPFVGFWIGDAISTTLRDNLKVELHNCFTGQKCSDVSIVKDEDGFWVACTITVLSDSVVDWIVTATEELERRAVFMINR
ncbi:MAG: hypothetical protein LBQ77_02450 [Treponema sp.]|jgi:hypothetical protein|nr:hypothetical protein [Treponema sp.]